MNLKIENIGTIEYADINLNGITIIAGDNNTGKSTIGKALYCIFNSCYNIEKYIERQKLLRISKDIEDIIYTHIRFDMESEIDNEKLDFDRFMIHKKIMNSNFLTDLPDSPHEQFNYVNNIFFTIVSESDIKKIDSPQLVVEEILSSINNIRNIPNKSYRVARVNNYFKQIFGDQIVNIFSGKGSVAAKIAGGTFIANFAENESMDLTLDFNFSNKATLIDSFDIIDDTKYENIHRRGINPHEDLYRKLKSKRISDSFDVDNALAKNKLSTVYNILEQAVCGVFTKTNSYEGDKFLFAGTDKPIKIKNLSSGVKSFLIIKKLCEEGVLSNRDVLILDEPEIHLHPEWQMIYAHALVVLQKEFDLTLLITSHSPAFVRSIECFCDIYNRMDILDVYKTKEVGKFKHTLENLSYSEYGISELYEDFSNLYETLEKMVKDNVLEEGEE